MSSNVFMNPMHERVLNNLSIGNDTVLLHAPLLPSIGDWIFIMIPSVRHTECVSINFIKQLFWFATKPYFTGRLGDDDINEHYSRANKCAGGRTQTFGWAIRTAGDQGGRHDHPALQAGFTAAEEGAHP